MSTSTANITEARHRGRRVIAGKAVLVTGANRGIGRALVEQALQRGANRVYAATRRPFAHPAERVVPVTLDVTDVAQIQEAIDMSHRTTIVVGASRGLGRGITTALAEAGAPVVAVSRSAAALSQLASTSTNIQIEVADAADATAAGTLLDRYEPQNVILVAGASPLMRPLQHQTWETFSANWHTDVRMAFHWVREALLKPLPRGSRVVVMSSGAALQGSPLSGGYAGAKATQRFIAAYAQEEANLAGLGLTFTSILPRITPLTDLGRPAVHAYAERSGQSEEAYMAQMGPPVTPRAAGAAVVELVQAEPASVGSAYLLTGAGLKQLP